MKVKIGDSFEKDSMSFQEKVAVKDNGKSVCWKIEGN